MRETASIALLAGLSAVAGILLHRHALVINARLTARRWLS